MLPRMEGEVVTDGGVLEGEEQRFVADFTEGVAARHADLRRITRGGKVSRDIRGVARLELVDGPRTDHVGEGGEEPRALSRGLLQTGRVRRRAARNGREVVRIAVPS